MNWKKSDNSNTNTYSENGHTSYGYIKQKHNSNILDKQYELHLHVVRVEMYERQLMWFRSNMLYKLSGVRLWEFALFRICTDLFS